MFSIDFNDSGQVAMTGRLDAAQAAKKFTEKQLTTWSTNSAEKYPLEVRTTKKDSFGRWIGHIMPVGSTLPELDLSAALVASGNAVPFMVGK